MKTKLDKGVIQETVSDAFLSLMAADDKGTLVDEFRKETNTPAEVFDACLEGTYATHRRPR